MPENPYQPPARRWFQFRLRTLLIAVAVFAVLFAWTAPTVQIVARKLARMNAEYQAAREAREKESSAKNP